MLLVQTMLWYMQGIRFRRDHWQNIELESVFLGEKSLITYKSTNPLLKNAFIKFKNHKQTKLDLIYSGGTYTSQTQLKKRGEYIVEYFSFYDSRPVGLFAKKILLHPQITFYIYPEPIYPKLDILKQTLVSEDGLTDSNIRGEEDFLGLSPYGGEDFKKVSWKHFARSDQLFIKEGLSPIIPAIEVIMHPPFTEQKISETTGLILECSRRQFSWSLTFAQEHIPMSSGNGHLKNCLERLSLCKV